MPPPNLSLRTAGTFGFLLVAPLVGGPAAELELRFAPVPGSSLTKTYRAENSVDVTEFSMVVDGNDVGAVLGDMTFGATSTATFVMTDTFEEVEDGWPQRITRSFDELSSVVSTSLATQFGDETQDIESTSVLDGVSVTFVWDPDAGAYEATCEDGELEAGVLDGLAAETDLAFLLPPGEVSEDDTWDVDLALFQQLVAPGGNLRLLPDTPQVVDLANMAELESRMQDRMEALFHDSLSGTAQCTFLGVEEEDGRRLGVIGISLSVETSIDLAPLMRDILDEVLDQVELPEEMTFEVDILDLTGALESEGELRWNLGDHVAHGLWLSTDGTFELEMSMAIEAGDQTPNMDATIGFSLSQENTARFDS